MSTLIMKFGGSAIGTVAALTQVVSIVLHEHKRWDRLLLVVSALDGITDMLIEAANLAQVANQRGYRRITANLRTRHLAQIEQLPFGPHERKALEADVDRLLFEMLDECQRIANNPNTGLSAEVSDRIIGVGERLSARIIAALLRHNNLRGVAIDGTDILITNADFGNAQPNIERTGELVNANLLPMLGRGIVPVVTGFIGRTEDGHLTTIGRGGSDYTASVLAVCTQADEVWLWSDVDGIMTADPREVPEARVMDNISYTEATELAYFGARILHPRMMPPLQQNRIPLLVKNVFKPQQDGSRIYDQLKRPAPTITSVTSIPGLALSAEYSSSLADINQVIDETYLRTTGSHAILSVTSQSAERSYLCYIVPTNVGGIETVEGIRLAIEDDLAQTPLGNIWQVEPVTIITAISDTLGQSTEVLGRILQQLGTIPIEALTQGPSGRSLSIIVARQQAEEALRRIHQLTIRNE